MLAQPGALEVGSVSEYVSEYVRGKFSFFHSIGSNYIDIVDELGELKERRNY